MILNIKLAIPIRTISGIILVFAFAGWLIWQVAFVSAQNSISATAQENFLEREELQIFSEFNEWLEKYVKGEFSDRDSYLTAGRNLAMERCRRMIDLIQNSPETALKFSIQEDARRFLPDSVNELLEKRISARGDFFVFILDETDAEGEFIRHRTKRSVKISDTVYEAFVYGRKQTMTTKSDIPLAGIVLDKQMAVAESPARLISPSEYDLQNIEIERLKEGGVAAEIGGDTLYFSGTTEFKNYEKDLFEWEDKILPSRFAHNGRENTDSSWTIGLKKLLFIRVDFSDRPGEPIDRFNEPLTVARAQNLINEQVSPFYENNSFNQTSIETVVTTVVRMPNPQSSYIGNSLNIMVNDARIAARAAGFDTDDFHLDIVAFSYNSGFSFSGTAPIGAKGALLNGSFTFKTVTHELGHSYGLFHANLWRTVDGTIIGNGNNVEYGDNYDMMGRSTEFSSHFNAAYKRHLNWISDANIKDVADSGVYRIFALDSANAADKIMLLRIPGNEFQHYFVEFRQLFTNVPVLSDAALIRWNRPNGSGIFQTQMLDMTPATTNPGSRDEMLLHGQTFTDNQSGIKITVLGRANTTPKSLDVRIEFPNSNCPPFDFDGDNKTDISIFRPAVGEWWYLRSSDGSHRAFQFGQSTDKVVPADYTGDGLADVAFFRLSTGEWFILRSEDSSFYSFPFGSAGDIPVPADFDGDGKSDPAVFRPSTGTWYILNSSGGITIRSFGSSSDRPVAADFDGDGKVDLAIFRPTDGTWWINRSATQDIVVYNFGTNSDKAVPTDYTGDGKTDIAFYRPSTGEWFILRSEDLSFYSIPFGAAGDIPTPGDYDGDGAADTAVFRPSNNIWYMQQSTNGFAAVMFGAAGDQPVPNAIVR